MELSRDNKFPIYLLRSATHRENGLDAVIF
jgi:hypothetical protein